MHYDSELRLCSIVTDIANVSRFDIEIFITTFSFFLQNIFNVICFEFVAVICLLMILQKMFLEGTKAALGTRKTTFVPVFPDNMLHIATFSAECTVAMLTAPYLVFHHFLVFSQGFRVIEAFEANLTDVRM